VIEFCILDVPSPYNAILGRPWIHMMRAVSSTHHHLLKYPTLSGMANIRGDQVMARKLLQLPERDQAGCKKHPEQTPMKILL